MGMELFDWKTLEASSVVGGDTIHMGLSPDCSFSLSDLRRIPLMRKRAEEQRIAESADILIEEKADNIMKILYEVQEEKRLLSVQGTLRDNWCPSKSMTKSFVVVNTDVYARKVVEALHQDFSQEVKFTSLYYPSKFL
jgi:hypothetical protein